MKYLSDYMTSEQTKIFNKTGAFFAFNQDQFDEKVKKNTKYVNLGRGMICPKNNVNELIDNLDMIHKNAIIQDIKENGSKKIIERAYFNYETQITMDYTDAMDSLKPYIKHDAKSFNKELIENVFSNCFQLAIEKDWF